MAGGMRIFVLSALFCACANVFFFLFSFSAVCFCFVFMSSAAQKCITRAGHGMSTGVLDLKKIKTILVVQSI